MLVSDVPMLARPKRITQASHHAVPDVAWQVPSHACGLDQSTLALIPSPRIVFHQGVFASDLSEGLQAHGVRVSVQDDGRTQVHCQKSLDDGMLLHVVYAWVAEDAPTASNLKVDYHVAPGCALSVCTHAWVQGDQAAKTQVDASVFLGAKAKLRGLYLRDHASAAWYHHEEHRLYLCEASDWDATFCDTHGTLLDRSVHLVLAETQAHATHRVLALLEGKQQHHHDVHTDHQAYATQATALARHVLRDRAQGHWASTDALSALAQKAVVDQQHRSIVLSDDAKVGSQPRLIVHADDVQCAHGSTVGALDEEALFYLRSRGFSAPQARAYLLRAFVKDLFEAMPCSWLRARAEAHVLAASESQPPRGEG